MISEKQSAPPAERSQLGHERRYGERATIPHGSDPEKFRLHLRDALKRVENDHGMIWQIKLILAD